jgi:hypothetical protein
VGDGSRATIGCLALLESVRTGRAVDFLVASADTAPVSCDTTASGLASPERMTPAMKAASPARRPAVAREASGG